MKIPKWKYLLRTANDKKELKIHLAECGEIGWELVTLIPTNPGFFLVFKRSVETD